jgi:hypothetical protein
LRKIARYTAGAIQTWDLAIILSLLYHSTSHLVVSILEFSSPTYYPKLSIYWLFKALNIFQWKSCQLQSFITFQDLQLLYW